MEYKDILNIRNLKTETLIKQAIFEVKENYKNLTIDRTCIIYSNLIKENLQSKHIPVRIISTKDLNYSFEHQFCLVPNDDNISFFLIDLTYGQFKNNKFSKLLSDGYSIIYDDRQFNDYLTIVTQNENHEILYISDVFYSVKKTL